MEIIVFKKYFKWNRFSSELLYGDLASFEQVFPNSDKNWQFQWYFKHKRLTAATDPNTKTTLYLLYI